MPIMLTRSDRQFTERRHWIAAADGVALGLTARRARCGVC